MRRRTLANIGMVAAFSAVCLAGISFLAVGLGLEVPFKGGWHLNANFAAAEGVVPEADVDVSGVHVGRVVGISGHSGSTRTGVMRPSRRGSRRRFRGFSPRRDTSASLFRRLRVTRAAPSAPRCTPTAFTSETATATFPIIRSGGLPSPATISRASLAKTASTSLRWTMAR